MKRFNNPILAAVMLYTVAATGQTKEPAMEHHARGTFTVEVKPLTPAPAEGLGRLSINKKLSGGLDGTTTGEMFTAGNPKQGVAGYVAIEVFSGILDGKKGTFALQHFATMDRNGNAMKVIIVPGSGGGELKGIEGTFSIEISNGVHSYDLLYTLAE